MLFVVLLSIDAEFQIGPSVIVTSHISGLRARSLQRQCLPVVKECLELVHKRSNVRTAGFGCKHGLFYSK